MLRNWIYVDVAYCIQCYFLSSKIATPLLNRLKLSKDKLATVSQGIRSIADQEDPIDKLLARTELAENLMLDKVSTAIGK